MRTFIELTPRALMGAPQFLSPLREFATEPLCLVDSFLVAFENLFILVMD